MTFPSNSETPVDRARRMKGVLNLQASMVQPCSRYTPKRRSIRLRWSALAGAVIAGGLVWWLT